MRPDTRELPAPPTFLFAVELDAGAIDTLLAQMEIPLAKLLHGEQSFTYRPACVGDTVIVQSRIDAIHDKKNGALDSSSRVRRPPTRTAIGWPSCTRLGLSPLRAIA